ncbi:hypothetical protein [Photorhabdus antumapuensis]|uniref:hypothetical protein n=1 Tax=Photorhabdus antumapuensis TaxID=2862867 RepID=UPI001CEDB5FC|nr:hypothetical protein [Photorhabdus antumapuensis]MCA6220322.1 hypothetical protein [Photorhabdus antumapuensis]
MKSGHSGKQINEDKINDYINNLNMYIDKINDQYIALQTLVPNTPDVVTAVSLSPLNTNSTNRNSELTSSLKEIVNSPQTRSYLDNSGSHLGLLLSFGGIAPGLVSDEQLGIGIGAMVDLTETLAIALAMAIPIPGFNIVVPLVLGIGIGYVNNELTEAPKNDALQKAILDEMAIDDYNQLKDKCNGLYNLLCDLIISTIDYYNKGHKDEQIQEELRFKYASIETQFIFNEPSFHDVRLGKGTGIELGLRAHFLSIMMTVYFHVIDNISLFSSNTEFKTRVVNKFKRTVSRMYKTIQNIYNDDYAKQSVNCEYIQNMYRWGYRSFVSQWVKYQFTVTHYASLSRRKLTKTDLQDDVSKSLSFSKPLTTCFAVDLDGGVMSSPLVNEYNSVIRGWLEKIVVYTDHFQNHNFMQWLAKHVLGQSNDIRYTNSVKMTYKDPYRETGSIAKEGECQSITCSYLNETIDRAIIMRHSRDNVAGISAHNFLLSAETRKKNKKNILIGNDGKKAASEFDIAYTPLLSVPDESFGPATSMENMGIKIKEFSKKIKELLHISKSQICTITTSLDFRINGLLFQAEKKSIAGVSLVPRKFNPIVKTQPFFLPKGAIKRQVLPIYLDGAIGFAGGSGGVSLKAWPLLASTAIYIPKDGSASFTLTCDDDIHSGGKQTNWNVAIIGQTPNGNLLSPVTLTITANARNDSEIVDAPFTINQVAAVPNKAYDGEHQLSDFWSINSSTCGVLNEYGVAVLDINMQLTGKGLSLQVSPSIDYMVLSVVLIPCEQRKTGDKKLVCFSIPDGEFSRKVKLQGRQKIISADIDVFLKGQVDGVGIPPISNIDPIDYLGRNENYFSRPSEANRNQYESICDASTYVKLSNNSVETLYRCYFIQGVVYLYPSMEASPIILPISGVWPSLAPYGMTNDLDAVFNVDYQDMSILYVFKDEKYAVIKWNTLGEGEKDQVLQTPKNIESGWPTFKDTCYASGIDAASLIGMKPIPDDGKKALGYYLFIFGNTYSVVSRIIDYKKANLGVDEGVNDIMIIDTDQKTLRTLFNKS